jgi:hypothetical protein
VRVWFYIIRAGGAQECGGRDLTWEESGRGLSGSDGPLDFLAEVTEVVWIKVKAQDFIDHGKEVRQRANRTQGRSVGGANQSSCGRQDEGIFDNRQRHTALMQLRR